MTGIDSNVLLRYLLADDEKQTAQAINFLTRRCSAEHPAFVNRIALAEIVWVLERVYRYSREQVCEALEQLMAAAQLEIEDRAEAYAALQDYRDGADFADMLMARLNQRAGCEYTATLERRAARHPHFRLL